MDKTRNPILAVESFPAMAAATVVRPLVDPVPLSPVSLVWRKGLAHPRSTRCAGRRRGSRPKGLVGGPRRRMDSGRRRRCDVRPQVTLGHHTSSACAHILCLSTVAIRGRSNLVGAGSADECSESYAHPEVSRGGKCARVKDWQKDAQPGVARGPSPGLVISRRRDEMLTPPRCCPPTRSLPPAEEPR